jgi:drug/metabolite transporter (DMT)-like permease
VTTARGSGPLPGAVPDTRHHVQAAWLMLGSALLFSLMGVCVKLASLRYGAGEIVLYRSLVGALLILLLVRLRGGTLGTTLPAMHFWRALTGTTALCLWFYSLGGLPLATSMTLNYMSSVWMALFLIGGSVMFGAARVDGRLVAAVLTGFVGVALVLRPTVELQQTWPALAGVMSGVVAALAYLQVTSLGRAGEPEYRIVFYFSLGGVVAGAALTLLAGPSAHSTVGVALLVTIGLLATAAQMMMTRAFAIGRVLSNAALQYLGIVFASLFGLLLFDEAITLWTVAGAVLIMGAGLAATLVRTRTPSAMKDAQHSVPGEL